MPNRLNLPGWTVLTEDNQTIATYDTLPESCPECGVVGQLHKWGRHKVTIRDTPSFGGQTEFQVDRVRLKCMACNATFMQPLPGIDSRRRLTTRAVDYIGREGLRRPFSTIAREIGIDEKTVRLIVNEHVETLDREFPIFAPIYLGIDEVMVAGELRCIFTDIGNRTILDLIEGRRKPTVVHWLSHMAERQRVEVVVIDMWAPYRDAARAVLGPKTLVVVDKFHVTRMADQALDMVRKAVGREKGVKGRRHLMRSRHGLLKRAASLSGEEQLTLSGWIENIPRLKAAYEIKEAFHRVYDITDRPTAEAALDQWMVSIPDDVRPQFKALLTSLANWRNEIMTYFDHRITNAFTEAMNRVVKDVARQGRGYTFPIMRARILEGYRPLPVKGWRTCEDCGRTDASVHLRYRVPMDYRKDEPDAKPARICRECHQTHIGSWLRHGRLPTIKSE